VNVPRDDQQQPSQEWTLGLLSADSKGYLSYMTPRRRSLFALLAILIAVPKVYADSDGYYCSAPGYLAVEFRAFSTPGLNGEHVLKILRFDEATGPRWTGEVSFEDFQPHALVCASNGEITAEGVADHGRGLVTYSVKVDDKGTPSIISVKSDPKYGFVPREGLPNLGLRSSPGTAPLVSISKAHQFQLRFINVADRRQNKVILHDKKTVLEERDQNGIVVRSFVVFEGTSIESTPQLD